MQDTTFVFGQLSMPQAYVPAAAETWSDNLLNASLALVAVAAMVVSLRDLYRVTPALLRSLLGKKGCAEAEYNMQTSRTRTWLSTVFMLPLCLLADRYLADRSDILPVLAFWVGFLLLRLLLYGLVRYRIRGGEDFRYAYTCFFTYLILATAVSLLAAGILYLAGAAEETFRTTLFVILSVFYLLFIVRKWQFLRNSYGRFTTFLYLCALEFLPLGILAALWVR